MEVKEALVSLSAEAAKAPEALNKASDSIKDFVANLPERLNKKYQFVPNRAARRAWARENRRHGRGFTQSPFVERTGKLHPTLLGETIKGNQYAHHRKALAARDAHEASVRRQEAYNRLVRKETPAGERLSDLANRAVILKPRNHGRTAFLKAAAKAIEEERVAHRA